MKIVSTVEDVREQIKHWQECRHTIGFVPTMGSLHQGHQSLIQKSTTENDKTIVSIFVNPMQFDPCEDFKNYPRNLDADVELCANTKVDMVFNPKEEEMYANDFSTFVDMHKVTEGLCAKSRPSHFRGVCTVVNKFFNIITPDRAYFGQKDAQQLAVIRKMVKDLNINVEIISCPIVRESDGLARSSRNIYLNPNERIAARVLSKAIFEGQHLIKAGERNSKEVILAMKKIIQNEPLAKIDYIEIVDSESMQKLDVINGCVLAAIAVFIGKTRLIDNFIAQM